MTLVPRTLACVLLTALFAGIACGEKKVAAPPPPPEVTVATVLVRDIPIYVEAIGETRGSTEIEVRARIEGFLQTVDYEEGSLVRKGQLLYTIDPRPFEATLAQAKGALAGAEAQLARAVQDVARYEPLVKQNAIPRETYDTSLAVQRAAEAAVEAARASEQSAKIDLSYTRVQAPAAGLAGRTEVYPGTLVGRGQSTLLTKISQVDTIHVRFSFSESDYLQMSRAKAQRPDAEPPPLEMVLADRSAHPQEGRFVFIDRGVDPETGTILIEAAFPNPEGIVRPGQYARVRAAVETRKGAILVPQRAVSEMQGIYSVAVVKQDDTVEFRPVTPGQRTGSLWVIDSGLNNGERIIVDGIQKVRPGVKVAVKTVTIEDEPADGSPEATSAVASEGAAR